MAARCKSWRCERCAPWLAARWRALALAGCSAERPGEVLSWWTLTDTAAGAADLPEIGRRMGATAKRFRRRGWWTEYFAVVEVQRRGALHVHALAWADQETRAVLRPAASKKRDRRQYAWHFETVVPTVAALGWGPVCDAAAVAESGGAVAYATKTLSGYLMKSAAELEIQAGARIRPVRASDGWAGGMTLGGLSERATTSDSGPWERVPVLQTCGPAPYGLSGED